VSHISWPDAEPVEHEGEGVKTGCVEAEKPYMQNHTLFKFFDRHLGLPEGHDVAREPYDSYLVQLF